MPRDANGCRRCSECRGEEHHFSQAMIGFAEQEPEHPAAQARMALRGVRAMSHATLVGALRCGCAYCGGEMAARALCKGLRALYDGALAKLEAAHA